MPSVVRSGGQRPRPAGVGTGARTGRSIVGGASVQREERRRLKNARPASGAKRERRTLRLLQPASKAGARRRARGVFLRLLLCGVRGSFLEFRSSAGLISRLDPAAFGTWA